MGTIIKIMGLHLWGTIITIWGLHGHNNNNNGATLVLYVPTTLVEDLFFSTLEELAEPS